MSETHWKKLTDTNYLGSWDLQAGTITATIQTVERKMIFNQQKNAEESCVVAEFVGGKLKPMILNKTNCKAIQKIAGTPYIERWSGQKIDIYKKKVKAFGEVVDALRVKSPTNAAPATNEKITCEECGTEITGVSGYSAKQIADINKKRYGKTLCATCSAKLKEAKANDPDGE